MDLTFIVPAKNDPDQMTRPCLESALQSALMIGVSPDFVLVADHSEEQLDVLEVFLAFRAAHPDVRTRIVQCTTWQHYTGVFATGLSMVERGHAFFLSNDMLMPPIYLPTILAVSGLVEDAGIVRGVSNYVDSLPEHMVLPETTLSGVPAMVEFARGVQRKAGVRYTTDNWLSGDAILIKRSLIQRIGVPDIRFFGYFGDTDYGLRAQLAGFRLVCAKGAWLYHRGGGHVLHDAKKTNTTVEQKRRERIELVRTAYGSFCQKWGIADPPPYEQLDSLDFRDRIATPAPELKQSLPDAAWADVELV